MTIALSKPILSRNQIDKMHWSKKSKESKAWEWEIKCALVGKLKKHQAKGPMKVKVTSLRRRLLDLDNLWGGGKQMVDSLKRLGLIVNDTPKLLQLEYVQKIQSSGIGTIVEIEELTK